uniref:DNA mismatch repair protein Mlh1 C-terminal domain-containing protein n=1 Tax=Ditylenchus dipsaci TaxID=166011 RepID=A0A915DIM3_9BILA
MNDLRIGCVAQLYCFSAQQFGVFQSKEAARLHVSTALRKLFNQLVIFLLLTWVHVVSIPSECLINSIRARSNENRCVEPCSDEMISIRQLLSLHFDDEIESVEVDKLVDSLLSNAAMCWDYFSIKIVLALCLDGYSPPLENLLEFVYGMASVNVTDERSVYEEVAKPR